MFSTRRQPLFVFSTGEGSGGDAGQAPSVETPETTDTPQGTGTDQQSAQVNWEDRYKEAQAWGTKSAQEAAELREYKQLIDDWNSDDAEAQRRAAARLGIQLEEEEQAAELAGEYAQLDPETRRLLEEVRSTQTQQQQTAQQEQQYAAYRADVDPQLKTMGVPEGLHELVAEAALNLPGIQTPQGERPDLQGAIAQIEQLVLQAADLPSVQGKVLDRYKKTKRSPAISSTGTAGTQVPNLDNRADRVAHMTERLLAGED